MGFGEVLRCALARFGVQISLFCPSEVDTPMLEKEKTTIPKETRALKNFTGSSPQVPAGRKRVGKALLSGKTHFQLSTVLK